MIKIIQLHLDQCHYCAKPAEIAQAINIKGVGALLGMAASPEHRQQVVAYRDAAVWQSLHCGERDAADERDLWFRIAQHMSVVLSGAKPLFDRRAAQAAATLAKELA